MKLVIDEQLLTAYALNELSGDLRAQVEAYLAQNPEAAAEVESIRATAGLLTDELAAETAATGALPLPNLAAAPMKIKRTRRVEAMLAMAASVALVAGSVTVMIRVASSDRTKTTASLNQIGTAVAMYSNEDRGLFPRSTPPVAVTVNGVADEIHDRASEWGRAIPRERSAVLDKDRFFAQKSKADKESLQASIPQAVDANAPRPALSPSLTPGGAADGIQHDYKYKVSEGPGDLNRRTTGKDSTFDSTLLKGDIGASKPTAGHGGAGGGGSSGPPSTGILTSATSGGDGQFSKGGEASVGPKKGGNAPADDLTLAQSTILDFKAPPAPPNSGVVSINGSTTFAGGVTDTGYRITKSGRSSLLPSDREELVAPKVVLRQDRPVDAPDRNSNESYDRVVENEFLTAVQNPLSTFSIDVDTASYSNIRRFLTQGQMPPKDAVRIEEMVNYFPYRYETPPKGDKPFAANVEVAGCPWNAEHRLVRVGIKGKEIAANERPATNLVFLIDVSGSMNEPNKLPLVKESLRKLVNKLDGRDRVAIVVYAGNSGLVLPSTQVGGFGDNEANELWHKKYVPMFQTPQGDGPVNYKTISEDKARAMYVEEATQLKQQIGGKQQILAAIDRLEAGGSTNGGAGIELAYTTAQSAFIKEGVNRVILATDGDFNVGVTDQGSLTRLIEEKAKSGTFLSVLGFGMGNVKDSTMEHLADKGNGNYAYIDTEKEAQKVLVDQMSGTLVTIAKDVKIQVEFNPAKVGSYRLIGYEKRLLAKEDFNNDKKDAGEIGAGHTITALYEVTPVGEKPGTPGVDPLKYQQPAAPANVVTNQVVPLAGAASNDLLTLKIRYKAPDAPLEQGTSKLLEFPVQDVGKSYQKASEDFKFAAAVASFGMVIRDSEFKGTANLSGVIELAHEGIGQDANGYRAEFVEMVKKAKELSGK